MSARHFLLTIPHRLIIPSMHLMSVGWHVCFVINYFASHLILKKNRYGYNNGYCLRVSEKTCHVTEVGKDLAANSLVPLCTL